VVKVIRGRPRLPNAVDKLVGRSKDPRRAARAGFVGGRQGV